MENGVFFRDIFQPTFARKVILGFDTVSHLFLLEILYYKVFSLVFVCFSFTSQIPYLTTFASSHPMFNWPQSASLRSFFASILGLFYPEEYHLTYDADQSYISRLLSYKFLFPTILLVFAFNCLGNSNMSKLTDFLFLISALFYFFFLISFFSAPK